MTVIEAPGGGWIVVSRGETLAGPFPTNAEAWRAADRIEGSPISPAEKRADWISTKILSGPGKEEKSSSSKPGKRTRQQKKRAAKNRKTKERKAKQMQANAAKAPGWVRSIAAAYFDPHGKRKYRDFKLGTFGPASTVREIDPADYVAGRPTAK